MQPSIEISDQLTAADAIVFAAVLLVTLAAVLWGHRLAGSPDADDSDAGLLEYLVMGRRLTLPLFTATLVATWYGGIFGVTEMAFQYGVYNFLTQGIFWYATYLIFALFLVPRLARYEALTLPDLVTRMFGPLSGYVAAAFNFFNVLPVAYAISIGLLGQMLWGGPLWLNMAAGTAVVCVYSMFGGLRAVVFSDLVQFGVMVCSVALVALFSVTTLGGLDFLRAHLPPGHFEPLGGNSLATTLVWGLIALSTLVDPNFYQRCFAAQSPSTARSGIIAATVIWCGFDLCTTLGGMYAAAALPTADSRQAYLIYALQLLPPGLRGFFLAGIAATILSTLDSYVFVAGNTLSFDLMPRRLRGAVWVRRLGVVLVGALAVVLGALFDGSIRDVWKLLGSYSAGCLLIPMMAGHLWPGALSDRTFVAGSLSGAVAITVWAQVERTGVWAEVDSLYIGCAVTATVLILGRLITRGAPPVSVAHVGSPPEENRA